MLAGMSCVALHAGPLAAASRPTAAVEACPTLPHNLPAAAPRLPPHPSLLGDFYVEQAVMQSRRIVLAADGLGASKLGWFVVCGRQPAASVASHPPTLPCALPHAWPQPSPALALTAATKVRFKRAMA